jgi:predicted DNA-binding transcriptional regulator AlpA
MKSDNASSKTKLAECLQISRPTLYGYLHLPDAPRPRSNGMWRVSEVRKYIRKQEGKRKITSTEKEHLEVELLRRRLTRVNLEIEQLDNSRQQEIADRITGECKQIIEVLNAALQRMPTELSGIFSMVAEPVAIYKRFKTEMCERFADAHEALKKIERASRKKSNIILFEASANGVSASKGGARAG